MGENKLEEMLFYAQKHRLEEANTICAAWLFQMSSWWTGRSNDGVLKGEKFRNLVIGDPDVARSR